MPTWSSVIIGLSSVAFQPAEVPSLPGVSAPVKQLEGTAEAPLKLLRAGCRRFEPVTAHVDAAQVSLLRWLRRQLREPTPLREHLEASVENDDPAEARRLVAHFEFTDEQRRNVEQLLEAWERTLGRGAGSSVGRAGDF